jgi:hypothetical protein
MNKIQHKISKQFKIYMRTRSLHSRQLCLRSAARTLPGDPIWQRDAERYIGN